MMLTLVLSSALQGNSRDPPVEHFHYPGKAKEIHQAQVEVTDSL